jgi:hypothetical protein
VSNSEAHPSPPNHFLHCLALPEMGSSPRFVIFRFVFCILQIVC